VHGVAVKSDVGRNFFASSAFVDITTSAAAPRTRMGVHGNAGAERHHVDDGRSSPCTASTTRRVVDMLPGVGRLQDAFYFVKNLPDCQEHSVV
jgi:hypothetical protein